jgi:hypothetical protein
VVRRLSLRRRFVQATGKRRQVGIPTHSRLALKRELNYSVVTLIATGAG